MLIPEQIAACKLNMQKYLKHGVFPLCILTIIYRLCTLKSELNSSGYKEDFCGIWSVSKNWYFYFLNWCVTMSGTLPGDGLRISYGDEK